MYFTVKVISAEVAKITSKNRLVEGSDLVLIPNDQVFGFTVVADGNNFFKPDQVIYVAQLMDYTREMAERSYVEC